MERGAEKRERAGVSEKERLRKTKKDMKTEKTFDNEIPNSSLIAYLSVIHLLVLYQPFCFVLDGFYIHASEFQFPIFKTKHRYSLDTFPQ